MIRINLAGNSLGDSGIAVLRSGLEVCTHVVYFDIYMSLVTDGDHDSVGSWVN